tara:strand:+ start:1209 stop:2126 length:918 start_codon:yes stop_codon:yes gene_type:complete
MSHQPDKLEDNLDITFGEYGWRDVSYKLGEKVNQEKESTKKEKEIVVSVEDLSTDQVATEIVVDQDNNNSLTQNIFGTTNPADFVSKSQEYAKALVDVVENQKLYANIQGKKYVTFEGWQFLGSMLPTAITPQTEWVNEIKDENTGEILGFKARVLALDVNGNQRGASESVCMFSERNWKGKDANHLMSMAQTRASSKALRMALSSIVKLAGYEPTPKEEMDGIDATNSFKPAPQQQAQPVDQAPDQQIVASPNKVASDKQIRWVTSLLNTNPESTYGQDSSVLESVSNRTITSAKADEIIKALK